MVLAITSLTIFSFRSVDNITDKTEASNVIISTIIEETFPEYSKIMDLNVDCAANCTFSSCSGKGDCTCSCRLLGCQCKQNSPPDQIASISMNKTQYNNTRVFANILKSIDDRNASMAYTHLSTMIVLLKSRDFKEFATVRNSFLQSLSLISKTGKKELNMFFEVIGAEERV